MAPTVHLLPAAYHSTAPHSHQPLQEYRLKGSRKNVLFYLTYLDPLILLKMTKSQCKYLQCTVRYLNCRDSKQNRTEQAGMNLYFWTPFKTDGGHLNDPVFWSLVIMSVTGGLVSGQFCSVVPLR